MNAAVAESEQRWQSKEQELQMQISELEAELRKEQLRVSLLHTPPATTSDPYCHRVREQEAGHCWITAPNHS